jgi:hypothetical protein
VKIIGVAQRSQGSMVQLQEDSGPVIEAWTPQTVEQVQAWNGTVPDGWELKDSKKGNKVLVEKQQRGGGGWRQSKEAFELEAAGRLRWQQFEEERKDRRTAAMTVYERTKGMDIRVGTILREAEELYDWLRETSGSGTAPAAVDGSRDKARPDPGTTPGAPQSGPGSTESDVQAKPGTGSREGAAGAPRTAPTAPGGVQADASQGPAPPGAYPMTPDLCNHKAASGKWLPTRQVQGQPVCPRCGAQAVIYRESG